MEVAAAPIELSKSEMQLLAAKKSYNSKLQYCKRCFGLGIIAEFGEEVKRNGFFLQPVMPVFEGESLFIYTCGLWWTYGHPEIVVAGKAPLVILEKILQGVIHKIKESRGAFRIAEGDRYSVCFPRSQMVIDLMFRKMDRDEIEDADCEGYPAAAVGFYSYFVEPGHRFPVVVAWFEEEFPQDLATPCRPPISEIRDPSP